MNAVEKLKSDLDKLNVLGKRLYYTLGNNLKKLDKSALQSLKTHKIEFVKDFGSSYESWYSESYLLIKTVMPERLTDFQENYKLEKRKELDYKTYTMSDYLIGLRGTRGFEVVVDSNAAIPKLQSQINILNSCSRVFDSSLTNLKFVLQADLFDTELDAAKSLNTNGFIRAAGALAGVVLERHLTEVSNRHSLTIAKKNPTINDLNELLKNSSTIDLVTWRFIQLLGDLRNLCDHSKSVEPTKEQISEMIVGVDKILKTVN